METKTISGDSIYAVSDEVIKFIGINEIENATIEYFFTYTEGIPTYTFKITYKK